MLCVLGRGEGTVGAVGAGICLAQCAAMFGSIFFVERALRRAFTPEGKRRDKT